MGVPRGERGPGQLPVTPLPAPASRTLHPHGTPFLNELPSAPKNSKQQPPQGLPLRTPIPTPTPRLEAPLPWGSPPPPLRFLPLPGVSPTGSLSSSSSSWVPSEPPELCHASQLHRPPGTLLPPRQPHRDPVLTQRRAPFRVWSPAPGPESRLRPSGSSPAPHDTPPTPPPAPQRPSGPPPTPDAPLTPPPPP